MEKNRNIILFLALAILFIIVRFCFDFNGLYGQDSFEYLRFTKELFAYWNGGPKPHDFFWPVGFPLIGSFFYFFTRDASLALQLVSLFSFGGLLIYLKKSLLAIFPSNKIIDAYILIFIFLIPFFLRAAFLCMSDMLAAFFITACFSHYLFYSNNKKWFHFSLCVFFGIASVFVRYGAALIVLVPMASAAFLFLKDFSLKALFTSCILAALAILPHYIFTSRSNIDFTNHTWLTTWSPQNFFTSSFKTSDGGIQSNPLINIIFCFATIFHPAYFLFGLIFTPGVKKVLKGYKAVLLFSIVIYLVFLAGIPYQNKRYFLIAIPFVGILLFEGYNNLLAKYNWFRHIKWITPIISICLVIYSFNLIGKRMAFEKKVFTYLEQNARNKNIYTFDVEVALRGYDLPANVIGLWHREYTDYKKGDLVLFNEENFGKQWKGHTLMKNWDQIKANNKLKLLHSFGDGWELYEIN